MFSVLMSIYSKEDSLHFGSAMKSIWDDQEYKPGQIVLVKDGPLTPALEKEIEQWKVKLKEVLKLVALEENSGLATALNEGLKHCDYDLVARMDTDDVAFPDRFKKQVFFMESNPEVSVCSGLVEEWSQDLLRKLSERRLPLSHAEILSFAKFRSPISHPAVIFRKSAVLSVGGYPHMYPEDYPLWGRMLANGYVFENLPDYLVKMRIGDALAQRRGLRFFKGEIGVYKYLLEIGFINKFECFINVLTRGFVRLSPVWIKKVVYKIFR